MLILICTSGILFAPGKIPATRFFECYFIPFNKPHHSLDCSFAGTSISWKISGYQLHHKTKI